MQIKGECCLRKIIKSGIWSRLENLVHFYFIPHLRLLYDIMTVIFMTLSKNCHIHYQSSVIQ